MPRTKNFDDTELLRALAALEKEMPVAGMAGLKDAASAFVETAKKKTKKAAKRKIEKDYGDNPAAYVQAARQLGSGASRESVRRRVQREEQKRVKAIGYQRGGWKIRRIRTTFIEIVNDARNSRFVKSTLRAARFAGRDILKRIPHLINRRAERVARKYSAK